MHLSKSKTLLNVSVCWCNMLHWTAVQHSTLNSVPSCLFLLSSLHLWPYNYNKNGTRDKLLKKMLPGSAKKITSWPGTAAVYPHNGHKEINFYPCALCILANPHCINLQGTWLVSALERYSTSAQSLNVAGTHIKKDHWLRGDQVLIFTRIIARICHKK